LWWVVWGWCCGLWGGGVCCCRVVLGLLGGVLFGVGCGFGVGWWLLGVCGGGWVWGWCVVWGGGGRGVRWSVWSVGVWAGDGSVWWGLCGGFGGVGGGGGGCGAGMGGLWVGW